MKKIATIWEVYREGDDFKRKVLARVIWDGRKIKIDGNQSLKHDLEKKGLRLRSETLFPKDGERFIDALPLLMAGSRVFATLDRG